jgi:hypothetical protein
MFELKVKSNIADMARWLTAVERRQLPFATALALTRTAQDVLEISRQEMERVFDRPTPYTLNSIAMRPASKSRLSAEVFFREFAGKGVAGGKYLKAEVYGGARAGKRSELLLRSAGLLRSDEFWVPAKGLPLDSYGNVPAGQMNRMLSQLRAQRDTAQNASGRRKRSETRFFVPREGSALPRGVWERFGSKAVRPVLIFVKPPRYTKRFDFYGIARRESLRLLPVNFRIALQTALETAKR